MQRHLSINQDPPSDYWFKPQKEYSVFGMYAYLCMYVVTQGEKTSADLYVQPCLECAQARRRFLQRGHFTGFHRLICTNLCRLPLLHWSQPASYGSLLSAGLCSLCGWPQSKQWDRGTHSGGADSCWCLQSAGTPDGGLIDSLVVSQFFITTSLCLRWAVQFDRCGELSTKSFTFFRDLREEVELLCAWSDFLSYPSQSYRSRM